MSSVKFIKLTGLGGLDVFIRSDIIVSLNRCNGEYTAVRLCAQQIEQLVIEKPADVMRKILEEESA